MIPKKTIPIPGKIRMYSPVGHIHGMWKRRQYTAIKDLALYDIPEYFFNKGFDEAVGERQEAIRTLASLKKAILLSRSTVDGNSEIKTIMGRPIDDIFNELNKALGG